MVLSGHVLHPPTFFLELRVIVSGLGWFCLFVCFFPFSSAGECYWTRCYSGVFSWNSGFGMEFIFRERENMSFSTMDSLGLFSVSLEAY